VGDQGAWPLAREKARAAGEVGKRPTVVARGDRRGGSVREVDDEDMWDGISRCTLFSNARSPIGQTGCRFYNRL
jgi:hypothetical protein